MRSSPTGPYGVIPASTKRLDNQRGRGEVGLDDGPLSLALAWVVNALSFLELPGCQGESQNNRCN
ncbi:hypothetical protein FCULG_00008722 [Fusarium culmorum]|uniref:Uncharacterized protein n=1 Tax=Fusarium culmorum TaxID=5516 RepID=A0A2T4H2D5_FUSCU|nr:hypothetical protein FCULG_00008722 [Fusarium culmorum]